MAIVESGREAVWQHAKEAGIAKDIALIAKYFDIKDISIVFNGKFTFLHERPRRVKRICVAAAAPHDLKWYLADARTKK
nr:unknown function [Klebsiella phage vB_Ko_K29PH164C1]